MIGQARGPGFIPQCWRNISLHWRIAPCMAHLLRDAKEHLRINWRNSNEISPIGDDHQTMKTQFCNTSRRQNVSYFELTFKKFVIFAVSFGTTKKFPQKRFQSFCGHLGQFIQFLILFIASQKETLHFFLFFPYNS